MLFSDLYNFAETYLSEREKAGKKSAIVSIYDLKTHIVENVNWIEDINFWPVDCREGDPLGHYECHGNAESRWEDDDAWIVLISYDEEPDRLNDCYQRLVWCKEMMHIFDSEPAMVHSDQRYTDLVGEIELRPLDPSEMYISENRAKWMALIILCPKPFRDRVKVEKEEGALSDYDIALRFRIPEIAVPSLMSDYYDTAFEALVSN
jgi:hypothetical protein